MKCRISSEHFQILQNLVLKPLWREGAKVYIFGSRSQGTHHPYSDVDLIFKSEKEVPQILISKIKEDIEESSFPDAVDLVSEKDLVESYRPSVFSQMKLLNQ